MSAWTDGYVADIGYTHGFYRELTPALLETVGLCSGISVPDLGRPIAYCELGCGQGYSANLLAAANPHVEYYATDFNPAHIVGAQALAHEAGTPNIHFYDQSFAEFLVEPTLPAFDVISLHGIYSWIAAEHRATIVEFIRRKLKPGGLVYISYNSLPGWSAAAPMRHLMYMHGKAHGGPTVGRLEPALSFVNRIIESNAGFFRVNPSLKERFAKTKDLNRNYLAHEYLNDAWTLLYHSDVAAEMGEAKLSYLGSAHLLDQIASINLSAEQQTIIGELNDPTLRETVRDFMVNQQFRRDVFIKGVVPLTPLEAQQKWSDLRVALSILREDVPMTIRGAMGEGNLQPEVYGPILDGLADGPKSIKALLAGNPAIAARGWAQLQQAIAILIGAGHLQPCLDQQGDAKRTKSVRQFNAAVLRQSVYSANLTFLASAVTGGGVSVNRITQLFLLGRMQKAGDLAAFAWQVLNSQNQRVLKDGKRLESDEENLAELRAQVSHFMTKQLPVFERLQVV